VNVFADIAPVYDLLYDAKDYDREAAFVLEKVRRVVPAAADLLDLGCGTGAHAERFAAAGLEVVGVDRSASMLLQARARQALLEETLLRRLDFREHDVRGLDLGRTFDAVVSLFHVLSYQVTDRDQARAFETLRRHVRPGGAVLFDFWHGPAVVAQRPETRVKRVETDRVRVTRIAEPVSRPEANRVDVHYTFFVQDVRSGHIREVSETHRMRYLFPEDIERSLAAVGLQPVQGGAWLEDRPADESSWAAYVLATTR
jgi:SAM-dependent methyltransferase